MKTEKIETEDGSKRTYLNGKLHSFDENPAIEYVNGTKQWN